MLAIGLMSGTSLDGIDAALVEIHEQDYKLIEFITLPYGTSFKARILKNTQDASAKLSEICSLNFELGYKFVEAIQVLLKKANKKESDISFVASHGQTIWHNPKQLGNNVPSTMQIGEPSVIAYETNIPTISDFRVMDVAANGEGAPLVPMADYLLYRNPNKNVILHNIGGISNCTYLKKGCTLEDVIAFDTGVGNLMIDYFTNLYFHKPYDEGGKIALSGSIIEEVLQELMEEDFVYRKPPKSTGREQYSIPFMENLRNKMHLDNYKPEDVITTITEFSVVNIVYNYRAFIKDFDLVIISGGGSHNTYIMKRLKELLKCEVTTQDEFGFSSDAKEAIAFVILGHLNLLNKHGNVMGVTGANKPVILGKITKAPIERK